MRKALIAVAALSYVTLSAASCTPTPTTNLVGPADRCMSAAPALPRPTEGEEAVKYSGRVIAYAKREASKGRCLQRYVRTVTR